MSAKKQVMEKKEAEKFIKSIDFKKGGGLVPTIIQDYKTGQVLTLAYSSRESLQRMITYGWGWYFSRERKKLWRKGERSGCTQEVISLAKDCDSDALLARVKQNGNACHKETFSCFGKKEFSLEQLFQIVLDRKQNPKEGSYTSSIFKDRKGQNKSLEKVGEEAVEFILAAKDRNKKEACAECADLLFHCMVALASVGVSWQDVTDELERRNEK